MCVCVRVCVHMHVYMCIYICKCVSTCTCTCMLVSVRKWREFRRGCVENIGVFLQDQQKQKRCSAEAVDIHLFHCG